MKKLFIIFFSCILLISNVGVSVFQHICAKDGNTISFFVKSEHKCPKEKEVAKSCCHTEAPKNQCHNNEISKDDCCSDEVTVIRLHSNCTSSLKDLIAYPILAEIQEIGAGESILFFINEESTTPNYPKPPPKSGRELLILKQVFII